MNSAQSWSVKGIDPKVREAAREAAARQGMSLGEYLNLALAAKSPGVAPTHAAPLRPRSARPGFAPTYEDADEDWQVTGAGPRASDPARLAQRIESIERRTQLAVTGLDRAVAAIDRSVLGLAERVEDAEAVSGETAERIADALEQFRVAGETLSGNLERAEHDVVGVREKLEDQVALAESVARRAEAAAAYLAAEMENRDAAVAQTLAQARGVAEAAARQAADASADAVIELRRLQDEMSDRLAETEASTRRAVVAAIEDVRSASAEETRATRQALLEEVVRLEVEIGERLSSIDNLKGDHDQLIARIERAENGARETTAGLRQAAGAAIADLRNAQLTLTARMKQVEDLSGPAGAGDLTALRHQQQDIAERLAALETKTDANPVADALAAFGRRVAGVETSAADSVDGAVKTMNTALERLSQRIAETESTANTAIRTLEESVSSIGARMEHAGGAQTEAVRAMLEQRLDAMAQSAHQMVGDVRGELQAALHGVGGGGLGEALSEVNHRLAAADRRHAQTIEAISLEIRRMSETVDKRLRAVEARNDDAAASAVREELSRMGATLEQRFDEIERREAAGFDRMGLEVGRLSERLEDRVGAVEGRSAQAIEQVGEQVARMAERFNQRQELLSRELGERMLDSEERASARVAEAIGSIMLRLAEVEQHSAEAIAPVQKAVSSVASKLERYESDRGADSESIPTPSRRHEDFSEFADFGAPEPSPMEAAQPLRAGPLHAAPESRQNIYYAEDDLLVDDILKADDAAHAREDAYARSELRSLEADRAEDDLLIDDQEAGVAARDEVLFWSPKDEEATLSQTSEAAAHASAEPHTFEFDDEVPPPPGKNDYLASARKAALAQTQQRARTGHHAPQAPTPKLSLRGSSRMVMWGAASVVAAVMATGAWYMNSQQPASPAAGPQLAREPTPPSAALEAQTPPDVLGPAEAAAAVVQTEGAAQSVVAGPLAPRNLSLEQAAQAGDLTAQYEFALQRIAAGATQEGATLLRRAADRGFAMAQYRLAKLYERGEGVGADLVVARQWTERAAASGNRRAMHDLGVYFARGEGAPLDEAAAFRWFRQAAELGVADSQYNLGVLYQQGRGVGASAPEALFWFLVAARQGDQDAAAHATALEAQLAPMQVDQARERSQAFRSRAASAVANGEFGARAWAPRA